jgi:molecular chaperone DnaK (HSP70)
MSEQAFPVVVGIDLGTTYSCIARVDERGSGKPEVIPNSEGQNTTPSVVFFEGNTRVVGVEAKNVALSKPTQGVEMVKRHIGVSEPDVPPWRFTYEGTDYTAEEISSFILRKVVGDAEATIGMPIKDVVITCPAYFGTAQREATALAGSIAGLNVLSIINEPTAAAIAYGMLDSSDQVVLVYDLGGGTFDITMIEIKGGNLTVIATDGDHYLGGRQWDERVVMYLAEQWKADTGSSDDPLDNLETVQDLFDRAERGKWALTTREKTDISVQHAGHRVSVPLTRTKFDELTKDLLTRTIEKTRQMLEQAAQKGYTAFNEILLVGGSTRMPQVSAQLSAEFSVPSKTFDPDQAVAKGAAIYALKLALDREFERRFGMSSSSAAGATAAPAAAKAMEQMAADLGVQLPLVKAYSQTRVVNVTSRSFGVIAWTSQASGPDIQRVTNLIHVNAPLPAEGKSLFGTYEANQEHANCEFAENLIPAPEVAVDQASKIGEALLPLPPNLPKGAPIEIVFRLNEQGRLTATARELSAGRVIEVELQTQSSLSQAEEAEARARSTRLVVS